MYCVPAEAAACTLVVGNHSWCCNKGAGFACRPRGGMRSDATKKWGHDMYESINEEPDSRAAHPAAHIAVLDSCVPARTTHKPDNGTNPCKLSRCVFAAFVQYRSM